MSKKLVKTINGEELPISLCRKYDKLYYKLGNSNIENSGDCYQIDNKYYRFETGQIVYNHEIKQYCLKTPSLKFGLIDDKNNYGWFSPSSKNIPLINERNTKIFAISEEVLINNLNYRERLSTGDYVHISLIPALNFNKIITPSKDYKYSLPYDSKGITDKYLNTYNALYDSKISNSILDFSKIVENLSFGLEFETIAGYIPPRITNKLGLIPLRDGSIEGIEYVTVPFSGPKGLQTIVDIAEELNKRTKYDYKCALHLHIGNIPRTKEFILAFFKLSLFLQDDIFALFPIYKKYNMGIKNKNYSKPYSSYELLSKMDPVINSSNITRNFTILFDYLAQEKNCFRDKFNNNLENVNYHPKDVNGNQKWNISTRYYFHNFIPLIFGNKQTIEFRIHTPTYDIEKIFMFIGLNSLLINYVIKNTQNILENTDFFISNKYSNSSIDNLIYSYFNNSENSILFKNNNMYGVSQIFESFKLYISKRKRTMELLTSKGNILIDENDVFIKNYFNFKDKRTFNSDYNPNIKLNEEILYDKATPVLKKQRNIRNTSLFHPNTNSNHDNSFIKDFYGNELITNIPHPNNIENNETINLIEEQHIENGTTSTEIF